MELKSMRVKILGFIKKYRYVAIIIAAGLLLMWLPEWSSVNDAAKGEQETVLVSESDLTMDETLSEILSQIKGAGEVRVLLTLQRGEETVYQTDSNSSAGADNSTTQVDTVIISGSERAESGLIKQINPPTYMGAIVVCQGADSPSVRLAIVEAVSKVTGLGADRISVLKMK